MKTKKTQSKSSNLSVGQKLKESSQLYLLMLPSIIIFLIFTYYPMYGVIIAFKDFKPALGIMGSKWVGMKNFITFFKSYQFSVTIKNTIIISLYTIVVTFPLPIIMALMVNQSRSTKFKKFLQVATYLPHFISMVIIAGMIREMLSTNGPINGFLVAHGHEAISFMALPEWFTTIFVGSGLWQGLGWGTILYLAAIAGISPDLYEAAEIDGANHFQRVWNITIPCILPTITTLLILDIGGLVGSGGAFEKVFLLYNPMTYEKADIISTYVYRMGIGSGNYSYATAVGLFEGLINLVLLTLANIVSKKTTESGLF